MTGGSVQAPARPVVDSIKTEPFPLIELRGSPDQIGAAYGRLGGDRIHRCIAIYRDAFLENGVDWERARRAAGQFLPRIAAYDEGHAAEIAAIARGAEVPVEDIVALNARTELLYGFGFGRSNEDDPRKDGCTGLVALPPATADGHLLHAQNWDWRDVCADVGIVLRIVPDRGPRILCFVEAGMLARCGFNEHGIAITGNYLECEQDGKRAGVPIPLIRRRVLSASLLAAAMAEVMQAQRGFSNNIMLSHEGGEAIDLETTPEDVFWIEPRNDLLVHANHFAAPDARARVRDVALLESPDTIYRAGRVRRLLESVRGRIDVATVRTALQDRYGWPRAVCRAPAQGPGGRSSSTVATIVMDVTAKRMWAAPRPYLDHSFTEYRLDEMETA